MSLPFENVREQLLLAGIAPRLAGRYVTELREHLTDLVARERTSGLDVRQAQERALTLMGSDTQLVQAALSQGAPRSLAARVPWFVLAACPVALLLLGVGVTATFMMQVLSPVRGLAPANMPTGYSSLIAGVSFFANYLVGPLLATGCIAVALRQRLASRWIWIGLCLIALVGGPLGFHMHYIPPETGDSGRTLFSAVGVVYRHGHADLVGSLSVAFVRAAVLFAVAATFYLALQRHLMPLRA